MQDEPKKGSGFSIEGVASAGGKIGGRISRRPRTIRVGLPLTSQEILFMADGISSIISDLTKEGPTDTAEIENCVEKATKLLMSGKWNLVFSNTTSNTMGSLKRWKQYLIAQWVKARKMIADDNLTNDDNEWLRSLRNVSEAYDVALNTKTKWAQEAKKAI